MKKLILALAVILSLGGSRASAEFAPGEVLLAELNCVACHRAEAATLARLASPTSPRLGANGAELTPQWLQAFLADPQTIQPKTPMPDCLHALQPAEKTRAAESLTHYLLSLQPARSVAESTAEESSLRAGAALYHTVGCVACHAPEESPEVSRKKTPDPEKMRALAVTSAPLGNLAMKYTLPALALFLKDPLRNRPAGRMPACKLDDGETKAVAMHLLREQAEGGATSLPGLRYEYYEQDLPELPVFDRLTPTAIGVTPDISLAPKRRNDGIAFRFTGTVKVEKEGDYKFHLLSDDGSRLFLNEKLVADNGGIHPEQERSGSVHLAAAEHLIRVEYFNRAGERSLAVSWTPPGGKKAPLPAALLFHGSTKMTPLGDAPFVLDATKVQAGAKLYAEYRCASCHEDAPVSAAPALAGLRGKLLAGCLAPQPPPTVPRFALTEPQRTELRSVLENQAALAAPLTPGQLLARTMTALNCFACHERDGHGGPDAIRREYFVSNGEVDLGDEGRIPPHLNGVGARLQTAWMKAVLVSGAAVRPYMATRMPQFGSANVEHLAPLFEQADAGAQGAKAPTFPTPQAAGEAGKSGRRLLGTEGLTCIACHRLAGHNSLGVPAIDLATTGKRLKWDYFRRYLLNPQALRPGTRMPSFWPEGVAVNRDILQGDREAQIAAIWAYLGRRDFKDLPLGLRPPGQELVAEKEPIIYRNFIQGAGSRAIGVGYPEKINLAFDANDSRLAMIWQGPFIDAAKQRTGRGNGYETPLGNDVVSFPPGPAFADLPRPDAPWPASGDAARFSFGGYRFDEKRRPTFRYHGEKVEVEDRFDPAEVAGAMSLRRTLKIQPGERTLYFRAAEGKKITELGGNSFLVDERLTLRFPRGPAILREQNGRSELLVRIPGGGETIIVEEFAW